MKENTTTGWPEVWNTDEPQDDNLTPEQAFDILFGYAEERHRNDPCARPEPQPYDGCEGQWPGDGSGFDDLADLGEQEGWDN